MKTVRLLVAVAALVLATAQLARAWEGSHYDYLCDIFLRTPKVDYKGDFTHKDIIGSAGMDKNLCEYSIGGLRQELHVRLANMLHAMQADGLEPGITACFRDDTHRPPAEGNASDPRYSFHGGRGVTKGHGDGEACDIVGLAYDRKERDEKNKLVWAWLREHGEAHGWKLIYGECDGGHIAPVGGREYHAKHGAWWCKLKAKIAKLKNNKKKRKPQEKQGRVMQAQVVAPAHDRHASR